MHRFDMHLKAVNQIDIDNQIALQNKYPNQVGPGFDAANIPCCTPNISCCCTDSPPATTKSWPKLAMNAMCAVLLVSLSPRASLGRPGFQDTLTILQDAACDNTILTCTH